MKKLLSAILCLSIIAGILCVPVSAKSPVNIFNVTVEAPAPADRLLPSCGEQHKKA